MLKTFKSLRVLASSKKLNQQILMKTKQNKSQEKMGKIRWLELIIRNQDSRFGFSTDLWVKFGQVKTAPDTWGSPKAFDTTSPHGIFSSKPGFPSKNVSILIKGIITYRTDTRLPWWSVVKNPLYNARDTGLIPGLGRSHMWWSNKACVPQLLNLCSRARAFQQEKLLQWEALAP